MNALALRTLFGCLLLSLPFAKTVSAAASTTRPLVYPGAHWETRRVADVGLSQGKLDALRDLVGGHGCVVRHGYMVYTWGDPSRSRDIASAFKPVLSTLMLLAVQQGKLKGVDDRVAQFEPRLADLNGGKDAPITWRHLASQTSGYGLADAPGRAFSYNDYAIALFYDVLMGKVFADDGTRVLRAQLAGPLGFEDPYTFDAFGPKDRPGRLAVSVRDLARFGLMYLRGGRWGERQILDERLVEMAISSPVPADMPMTAGNEAPMLPGQRTLGGGKNIAKIGPGYYSFNWWLNRTDRQGRRLIPNAPADTFMASGHGGPRMLWVIPSLDLIVAWNDARTEDFDASHADPDTRINRAAILIRQAVMDNASTRPATAPAGRAKTQIGIVAGKWRINGAVTYPGAKAEGLLMNVRVVNAVFEDQRRPDFDPEANADRFIASIPDYVAHGVRAFTLGLQGGFPGYEGAVNSAFNPDGTLRQSYMKRVERVIEACDRRGAAVILGCYYQRQDQILRDEPAVRAGVANVARWTRECGFTNVLVEVANEFGHGGYDHRLLRTPQGMAELIGVARAAAPELLISASGGGGGELAEEAARASDFLLIHFNNTPLRDIGARIASMKRWNKPIVCNEDAKTGAEGAQAAGLCVRSGASWGLMAEGVNQRFPFAFGGASDDVEVYAKLKDLTVPAR